VSYRVGRVLLVMSTAAACKIDLEFYCIHTCNPSVPQPYAVQTFTLVQHPRSELHKLMKKLTMDVATDVRHILHVVKRPSSSQITKWTQVKQFDWQNLFVFVVLLPFICLYPSVKQPFASVRWNHIKKHHIRWVWQTEISSELLCPMLVFRL
jgi:hypothetical protein